MMLPKGFDGKLQWTLEYGGAKTTTTMEVLNPLYAFEEADLLTEGLDRTKASPGVCVNRPPHLAIVTVGGGVTRRDNVDDPGDSAESVSATYKTRIGDTLNVFVNLFDDGLPRGSALTRAWSKVMGPGTVTFLERSERGYAGTGEGNTDTTQVTVNPQFSAPGTYDLEMTASDGALSTRVRVRVVVAGT